MQHRKRTKVTAALLALCMLVSLLPVTAFGLDPQSAELGKGSTIDGTGYVYEGVFYGVLLKNTERGTKIPISCGIFLLIAYGFWYSLSHNSQGVMPYLFII